LAVEAFGDELTVSTVEHEMGESNSAMLRGLKAQYPAIDMWRRLFSVDGSSERIGNSRGSVWFDCPTTLASTGHQ
jgi:hypothetical protein